MFSCEFCEISKNTFAYRIPPVAGSVYYLFNFTMLEVQLIKFILRKKGIFTEGIFPSKYFLFNLEPRMQNFPKSFPNLVIFSSSYLGTVISETGSLVNLLDNFLDFSKKIKFQNIRFLQHYELHRKYLPIQNQQYEYKKNMRIMFKVHNKDTRTMSMTRLISLESVATSLPVQY